MIKKTFSFMNKSFWSQTRRTIEKFEKFHPVVRSFVGLGLVIIGILGIILPILPGWIFLIPGIMLLLPFTKKWLK